MGVLPDEGDSLARAYWANDQEARERVGGMATRDPDDFWALLPALLRMAPDEDELSVLGADALETFVDEHGAHFLDRIDAAAAESSRLRVALRAMWDGPDAEVNDGIRRIVLRGAAEVAEPAVPAGASVVARRLFGPSALWLDDDEVFCAAGGEIDSQTPNVLVAIRKRGGEKRIVGRAGAWLAGDSNAIYVGSQGRLVALDKRDGAEPAFATSWWDGMLNLTAAGGRLFWTAVAVIRTVPVEGGAPRTLVIADSPRTSGPTTVSSLTSDGERLYWVQYGPGEIVSASLDGDDRRFLLWGESSLARLVCRGARLFWSTAPLDGVGAIRCLERDGGRPITLATGRKILAIAVDDAHVYWTDLETGTLQRVAVDGGPTELLASGLGDPMALALDDDDVYLTSDTYVLRIAKRANAATTTSSLSRIGR